MSDAERKTWIRGCWASLTASQALSTPSMLARVRAQIVGRLSSRASGGQLQNHHGAGGKACFNNINAEPIKLPGYFQLIREVEAGPSSLLTISQSSVENYDLSILVPSGRLRPIILFHRLYRKALLTRLLPSEEH